MNEKSRGGRPGSTRKAGVVDDDKKNVTPPREGAGGAKRKGKLRAVQPDERPDNQRDEVYLGPPFHMRVHEVARAVAAAADEQKLGVGVYRLGGSVIFIHKGREHLLTEQTLKMRVTQKVRCLKESQAGQPYEVDPPSDILRAILQDTASGDIPDIANVIRVPVFDSHGRLVKSSGYDTNTRTMMQIDPAITAALADFVPEDVTKEMAVAAHAYLEKELLGNFPFMDDDDADKTGAMCMSLQPVVRQLFDGPSPLYAVDAHESRTGKGLLVKVMLYPILGDVKKPTSVPTREEEWAKKIFAELRTGPDLVWFDNAEQGVRIKSGVLAMYITTVDADERILGESTVASVRNLCVWVITGNDLRFSEENARRAVPIRLDWKGPGAPEDRTKFKHPDLLTWAAENRPTLVRMLLTIVAHWINVGRPDGRAVLGGFEGWARTMSGILESVDVDDLLTNRDAFLTAVNADMKMFSSLVELWQSQLESGVSGVEAEMRASDLVTMVGDSGIIELSGDTARSMGNQLQPFVNRESNGFRLRKRNLHGIARYWLEVAEVG